MPIVCGFFQKKATALGGLGRRYPVLGPSGSKFRFQLLNEAYYFSSEWGIGIDF